MNKKIENHLPAALAVKQKNRIFVAYTASE